MVITQRPRKRRFILWAVNLLALALLAGGCLALAAPHVAAAYERWAGSWQNGLYIGQFDSRPAAVPMELGTPIALSLPRLGVQLQLLPGQYNFAASTWRLDPVHAFYVAPRSLTATLPATPLVYGHNIASVFAPLAGVAANELLEVTTQDGRMLQFRYSGDQIVSPTDDSVLRRHLDNTVLLMTCDGAFSQNRRVLQFVYTGVE